jgi:hypothetical protein
MHREQNLKKTTYPTVVPVMVHQYMASDHDHLSKYPTTAAPMVIDNARGNKKTTIEFIVFRDGFKKERFAVIRSDMLSIEC